MKLFSLIFVFFIMGCGVKGDPMPPEKPPSLGRGEPSYLRATEDIVLPDLPELLIEETDDEDVKEDE